MITQTVQLRSLEDTVVTQLDLPARYPTPRIIVYNDTAYIRSVDLIIYRATNYLWVSEDVNVQRLVNDKGEQVWQQPLK